jgi:hypothetical protein
MRSGRQPRSFSGTLSEYRERNEAAGLNQSTPLETDPPLDELATSIQASAAEIAVMWVLHSWSRTREQRAENLDQQIKNFSTAALAAVAAHHPILANAEQKHLWMIYFKGLLDSNTHPREQMIQAIKTVGARSCVQVSGETTTHRTVKPARGNLSDLDVLEHISQVLRQTNLTGV